MNKSSYGLIWVLALMLVGPALAEAIRPTKLTPYVESEAAVSDLIPRQFGTWAEVQSRAIVRPTEETRSSVSPYDQELYRVYQNDSGEQVMFVIAFGHNQSDTIQLHRPEVCYRANGFDVVDVAAAEITPVVGSTKIDIPGVQLMSKRQRRSEPVTYWTRVGPSITANPLKLQLEKLWTGLKGQIPDGALVRVSSLGTDRTKEFAIHSKFIGDLLEATGPLGRAMLIGERATQLPAATNIDA